MKKIYEEFGSVIVVVVVVALLLGLFGFLLRPGGAIAAAFSGIVDKFKGDSEPSEVVLTVDPFPEVTENPLVSITGTVTDDSGTATVTLGINGVQHDATVNSDGSWFADISLNEGENVIFIKAVNESDKSDSKFVTITVNAGGPELLVNALPEATGSSSISVSGTAKDASGDVTVVVTVGDQDYEASVKSNGSWTADNVVLSKGNNTIFVKATDDTGKSFTMEYSIYYDDTSPVLAVDTVEDITSESNVVISGTVTDDYGMGTVTVTVGAQEYVSAVDGDNKWSVKVALSDGDNKIKVVAIDKAGNSSDKEVSVQRLVSGEVKLSETSGTVTYPNTRSFEVVSNLSGGALSVNSSNKAVADVSIEGNTITVKPGTSSGSSIITVTSAAKGDYTAATAIYTVTVKNGTLSVTASGYEGTYDGKAHGISVSCDGATITYATSETGDYESTNPTYTNAGTYTVYYKVEKAGYTTATGSKTVVINKASISVDDVPSQDGSLTYNGKEQSPAWSNFDSEKLTLGGTTKGTDAGTYSATFTLTGNYQWSDGTTDAKTVAWTIGKAAGSVTLSETSGTLTYPDSGSFDVETNISGGELSVKSSDEDVATVSIDGTKVTVKSGSKAGEATITVTSAATDNHNAATATYTVTVEIPLTLTVDVPEKTDSKILTVTGTVTGGSGAKSITVNGTNATVAADGTWSADISLTDGEVNELLIVATDNLGSSVTETRHVLYEAPDTTAPVLTVTTLASMDSSIPTAAESNTYTISGSVSDNVGVASLSVNGNTVAVDKNGNWSMDISLTDGKLAEIVVVATDDAGNSATETRYVVKGADFTVTSSNRAKVGYAGATDEELVIPETFYDENDKIWYRVVAIDSFVFSGCTSLTSVTIPDSVTYINHYAFNGCTSLTSVTIPDSVTSIGTSAFEDCAGLTSITIPDSVSSIGDASFAGCTSLTSVTIPDSVTSIGMAAFEDCTGLTSIIIPNSVTSIGNYALRNCVGLTSVTIPNSITSISNGIVSGCTSLTDITIPNSVTSIGNQMFYGCTALTSVTIPDSVTSIGKQMFYGCTGLTSLTIGDKVTSIGNEMFSSCTSLTDITIPDSVTSIGNKAFYGCTSLTSLTIGDGVTSIGNYAFWVCSRLTSVTIPDSVTSIGIGAFEFTGLRSVIFNDTSTWYYTDSSGVTSGGTEVDVSDDSTAAELLKSTYASQYWYKS